MTNEEKAEIYTSEHACEYDDINVAREALYQAYLDGFTDGNPKWHDLRKNPDDLPKHSGLYCTQCGEVREFDKEELSWFTVHFAPCRNCTEDTYAWCELLKFEG